MVSHANAHLNWTAGWLVPLLLWRVLRAARARAAGARRADARRAGRGRVLDRRRGAVLHRAGAARVFLGVWALGPAAAPRRGRRCRAVPARARRSPRSSRSSLLAYPLWLHFFGPQRFHGTGFDPRVHAEDIAAFGAFPQRSLAGVAGLDTDLAPNPTEENSFFGLPLLVLAVACFVLLWRRADPRRRATLRGARRHRAWSSRCSRSGRGCKWLRAASPTSRCRTRCWAGCRSSTPRCRPGWRWWSRR